MKTAYKITCLALLLVLLVTLATNGISAAPLATRYGAQPLYDSGWTLTPWVTWQNYNHNLDAYPTLIQVYIANNASGYYPIKLGEFRYIGTTYYGGEVRDVTCTLIRMHFNQNLGYSIYRQMWYQRGTAYARVLVFAADTRFKIPECD